MGRCAHSARTYPYYPSKPRIESRDASSLSRYIRVTLLVNPDTWQVETVKVDEMSCALRLTDALYLAFTSGEQLSISLCSNPPQ